MSKHELLDIVSLDGQPTGQLIDKAVIHDQGLWHRDVHVWVTNGRDILQQQRAWDKTIMPGEWDVSVGGHVGAGESYLDAAQRETAEELGLDRPAERFIRAGILAVDMAMGPTGWRHRTVGDNFVLVERGLRLEDVAIQESEVIGARWYPIDQLEADLARPETARQHASQPAELWALGIAAMRDAVRLG
ncbi:MAG TPA: NUDIX domain-containing protein [Candidatus Saccharimonadales bacterium]|nr:NUDIX domain-containing protein [Candidatus Saccharimonadales bacterium]